MLVILVFPDDSSARMTYVQATALMVARGPRHGLRVYAVAECWNGTRGRDPYLTAHQETHRRQAEPSTTLGTSEQRVRTIQSITDLPEDEQAAIAADGQRLGPEVAGRRWNLSKQTVTRVMKLRGLHKCPPTAREALIFSRAHV